MRALEHARGPRGRRRLCAVVLGAVAAWAAAAHAHPEALTQTIKRVKPAIVAVGTYEATRRPPAQLLGTGFAVADGRHIVTNAHVVPEAIGGERREFLAVFVGAGAEVEPRRARLAAEDAAHDVAILEIAGSPLPALRLGRDEDVEEGEAIAFTGFPIGAVLGLYPATHTGVVAALSPIATPALSPRQLDARTIKRLRTPYQVFQLDATAYPGNSGSPVYDPATGEVLGVISSVFVKESKEYMLSDPSGITYAIPVRYARALIERLGLGAGGDG